MAGESVGYRCTRCAEVVDDGFDACWHCGCPVPESALARAPEPEVGPDSPDPLLLLAAGPVTALRLVPESLPVRILDRVAHHTGLVVAMAVAEVFFRLRLDRATSPAALRALLDAAVWRPLLGDVVVCGLVLVALGWWRRHRRPRVTIEEPAV